MSRINTSTMATAFNVTPMTIYLWRKGAKTRAALPTLKPKKGEPPKAVLFDVSAVIKWADRHAVNIPNRKALTVITAPAAKTGPKPKPLPAA